MRLERSIQNDSLLCHGSCNALSPMAACPIVFSSNTVTRFSFNNVSVNPFLLDLLILLFPFLFPCKTRGVRAINTDFMCFWFCFFGSSLLLVVLFVRLLHFLDRVHATLVCWSECAGETNLKKKITPMWAAVTCLFAVLLCECAPFLSCAFC